MKLTLGLKLILSFLLSPLLASSTPLESPHYLQRSLTSPRNITTEQVRRELGSQLSNSTSIFGPLDARFPEATARWNVLEVPKIQVVVQVGRESDVAKIVKYCIAKSIQFLAVNQGHSLSILSMKKFNGIQIDLKRLNGIAVRSHRQSALLQAGTYGREVISSLWSHRLVAATGAHECVGFAGFALGGGHGRYEGFYGLGSDNIIRMNTVLADGSILTVDETKPDLYWAMKGAGHNFGIVTSMEVRVYPIVSETWHYHEYHWSGDKLEAVFESLNRFHGNGSTPVAMGVNFGSFTMNPRFSNSSATISFSFAYAGPADEAEILLQPFNDIESLAEASGDVPYPEIPVIQGTSIASGSCAPTRKTFTHALIQTYNVTNERYVYDRFNENAAIYPELAPLASVFYEGYSTAAVEAIPDDASAYPHRHEYHILYFQINRPITADNATLREISTRWGEEVRASWNLGRLPATYVNYANGDESLESIYGYELWRLEKLRRLKNKYDPHNRFRYHAPIIPG